MWPKLIYVDSSGDKIWSVAEARGLFKMTSPKPTHVRKTGRRKLTINALHPMLCNTIPPGYLQEGKSIPHFSQSCTPTGEVKEEFCTLLFSLGLAGETTLTTDGGEKKGNIDHQYILPLRSSKLTLNWIERLIKPKGNVYFRPPFLSREREKYEHRRSEKNQYFL